MDKQPKLNIYNAILGLIVSISILFPSVLIAQAKKVSTESELQRLYSISHLPVYINGTEVHQVSSYDRKGGNNDGFEGTFSYLRKNEDGSLVIFEAEGKGVIERIWTPTPTDDTLDFYFDGSQTPSYSIKFRDLFTGNVFPFVSPVVGHKVGGFYSYLPIPYNRGCKIVFRGKRILFHQIQYRKYDDKCTIETFNPTFSQNGRMLLNNVATLWNKEAVEILDIYKESVKSINSVKKLLPGQSIVLANLQNSGRVVGIELQSATMFEGLENLIDIKITWDNEKHSAIYAPAADFFGFAFGSKSMQSLLLGVDAKNRAYCYIPMPFDKNAKLELVYRKGAGNTKPVTINSTVYYNSKKRDLETEGKFYANWKRDEPALGKPYVFLEGKGKGHYVGTILQSQGKTYNEFTEFFEGDDSTVIDGINALHGTGSEDYFNGGWYAQPGGWVERLGAALHGCLDYSLPYSRTGGYRFYLTDKLPFNLSFYHSIEHGPEKNNRKVDYTSIAMYYADRPIEQTSIPSNKTSKVFLPDTLTFYARLMDHLTYEGNMGLKNGAAKLDPMNEGVIKVNVAELQKGIYQLHVNLAPGNLDESEVGLEDGKSGSIKWNKLKTNTKNASAYYIGDVTITDTRKPVKVAFKTNKNAIELHQVMLIKK